MAVFSAHSVAVGDLTGSLQRALCHQTHSDKGCSARLVAPLLRASLFSLTGHNTKYLTPISPLRLQRVDGRMLATTHSAAHSAEVLTSLVKKPKKKRFLYSKVEKKASSNRWIVIVWLCHGCFKNTTIKLMIRTHTTAGLICRSFKL